MNTVLKDEAVLDDRPATAPILETHSLVKRYDKITAVNDLSFAVAPGTIYGLLGRNSAGKTTTMKLLMGLARPHSGYARVFGLDPAIERERIEIYRRTGFVDDQKVLFIGWTLAEMLKFNSGLFPRFSAELAARYVEQLEVPLDQKFIQLSLGNKTKAGLVLALSQGADLLLLDEPTQGLDPVAVDRLLRILVEDFAAEGKTIVFCSHQLADVERIADRVGIIDHGRMRIEVDMEELRAHYRWVRVDGAKLPSSPPGTLHTRTHGATTEYLISTGAEQAVTMLQQRGAENIDIDAVTLSELFLALCG
jgi:ABC-2 type transport system ATP-binding protein